MKKSLLSILTLALVAVGCQNYDDQFDSLNTQITALTTKVDGLPPDTSSAITAINNAITALQTQVSTLGTSALSAGDLTSSLVDVLQQIAAVKSDLALLDTQVASNITGVAGVATSVADITTQLSDVATAQLTEAQVTAIVAVTDQTTALTAVQDSLNELLAADAALVGDLSITNSAELLFAQSRIDVESANDYILQGNLTVNTTIANSFPDVAAATTAINLLTAKITNVVGNVAITSASDVATGTIDITKLVYVSGTFAVVGSWNADTTVLTTAVTSFSVPINSAHPNFVLSRLIAGGAVTLVDDTDANSVSPTVVDLSACTGCTSVITSANTLNLPGAAVNLGTGAPAKITTVGSLLSTSAAALVTGSVIIAAANATTGADGSITLNSLTVTNTKITAGGAVTLGNGAATSTFGGGSVVFANGPISISNLLIGGAASIISNTLSSANITIGAKKIGLLAATASNTATIDASAALWNYTGAMSLSALEVNLAGLITNTAQLDIVGDTDIQLPSLEASAGAINATTAITFNAPKLITDGAIDLEEGTGAVDGAAVTVKSLTVIGDFSDFVNLNAVTIKGQVGTVALDFSTGVQLETINYAGLATAAGTTQANNVTYVNRVSHPAFTASLTTLSFAGNIAANDVLIKAPLLAGFATEGGMRTLTVTSTGLGTTAGGTLKTLTIGNTGLAEGDGSQIDIKTTGITSLDISTFTKLKSIVVTGNTSMTAFTFPAGVTTATNVVGYLAKTITVEDNFIAGVFSAGASQTQSSAFVETSFTSVGITNAIAWITFSNNEDTTTSGQITFTIEVDQVGTVINQAGADTASAGTLSSAIWDNNDHINTLAELGLLPN